MDFFTLFFSNPKNPPKNDPLKNYFFGNFWRFLVPLALISGDFGSQNWSPEGNFRVFFEKRGFLEIELSMVIWPSFEGRTLPKSLRRALLNGNAAKILQKSAPAPSPDALFQLRARFWLIFGSQREPQN